MRDSGTVNRGAIVLVSSAALLAAACGSSAPPHQVVGPAISWLPGQAESANGVPPSYTAAAVCGSSTETYLAELLHTAPTAVKVLHEWSDIVPGGKQVLVSGRVATTHLGPTDLPMSHPYGDDLSMDINIDPQFLPFAKQLGVPAADEKPGQLHVEISSGFIPHMLRPGGPAAGQTWRQLSDFNLTGFQPGFDKPALGDRIVLRGRWIIDCGHGNYGTELHPLSYIAWAHTQGSTTTIHVYANPYSDTEAYSPDASLLGKVTDTARFSDASTKAFPPYLVDEVVRLLSGKTDHLRVQELIAAVAPAKTAWSVCAPSGVAGRQVSVRYDFVTRPGVSVQVVPDTNAGCASVNLSVSDVYQPLDAQVRPCALPWTYLNDVAATSLGHPVDVKALIDRYVAPSAASKVGPDPTNSCADGLAGPLVSETPAGHSLRTDGTQPIPFYGVITVGRS